MIWFINFCIFAIVGAWNETWTLKVFEKKDFKFLASFATLAIKKHTLAYKINIVLWFKLKINLRWKYLQLKKVENRLIRGGNGWLKNVQLNSLNKGRFILRIIARFITSPAYTFFIDPFSRLFTVLGRNYWLYHYINHIVMI